MKIRPLVALAALAASSAALLSSAPASAWECPKNVTRPYYVTTPAGEQRVCVPDLNCETCYADVR